MRLSDDRRELFKERLKQACVSLHGKEHGIATFLSETIGVSNSTASKYLNGHVLPSPDRWGEIAQKLGVSTQWLMGTDHATPDFIVQEHLEKPAQNIGRAARITFPLVIKLKPDASDDEIEELTRLAYQKLQSGEPENAIAGDIASLLLQR